MSGCGAVQWLWCLCVSLTVLALYCSIVVLLPEADVSQVEDPSHQLQHSVLLLGRQAHH